MNKLDSLANSDGSNLIIGVTEDNRITVVSIDKGEQTVCGISGPAKTEKGAMLIYEFLNGFVSSLDECQRSAFTAILYALRNPDCDRIIIKKPER